MGLISTMDARKLCKINGKAISLTTFNKFVYLDKIKVREVVAGTHRLFDKDEINAFAKTLPKTLKQGFKIIFKK